MELKEAYETICTYLNESEKRKLLESNLTGAFKGGVVKPIYKDLVKQHLPYIDYPFKDEMDNVFCYRQNDEKPGLNVLHFGGVYYLLDPSSAFVPNQFSKSNKTNLVLDMCAAPGGKTITYAIKHPNDLIIANEISLSRANELTKNIERMGLANVIVTCMDPQEINDSFNSIFDRILLDAPCSGSGMFCKEPKMLEDWTYDKVIKCSLIQKQLLKKAIKLCALNGEILYSTCSYSNEEDDEVIEATLDESIEIVNINSSFDTYKTKYGNILFPYIFNGEGQYVSKLRKIKGDKIDINLLKSNNVDKIEKQYVIHPLLKKLPAGLKIIKPGIKIYDNREHSKIIYDNDYKFLCPIKKVEITYEQACSFIKGSEVFLNTNYSKKEEVVVTYKDIPLGYGRIVSNKIKNLLPKGLYAPNIRL